MPPWTVSRDGQFLLVAQNDAHKLRFVRADPMYVTWDLPLDAGQLGAVAWLARRRGLALEEISGERQRLLVIDLPSQKILARRSLPGAVAHLERTRRELVLLLAPPHAIGRARLAVVDRDGRIRFARIDRVLAGSKLLGTGSNHRVDSRTPGLAVDPDGRRAFVVGQDVVAEVDLQTLSVSYRALRGHQSLLGRLWNWLEPAAQAKRASGYDRRTEWIDGGLIAVSGSDSTATSEYDAAGLALLDTRTWDTRTLDADATWFEVAGDLLIAMGGGEGSSDSRDSVGVAGYELDGTKRFQLLEGKVAWIALVLDGRAYVGSAGSNALRIVDLATGHFVGSRSEPLPWLLLGTGGGWWD